jgi:hypothetical protein
MLKAIAMAKNAKIVFPESEGKRPKASSPHEGKSK